MVCRVFLHVHIVQLTNNDGSESYVVAKICRPIREAVKASRLAFQACRYHIHIAKSRRFLHIRYEGS